jgi:hypothetical protein
MFAVVHRKTIFASEVLADVAAAPRGSGHAHRSVASWVSVAVMHTKQERICRGPRHSWGSAQRRRLQFGHA